MFRVYGYIEADVDKLVFNHWSRHFKNKRMVKNVKKFFAMPETYSFTICDGVKPVAIIAFHEEGNGQFYGAMLTSVDYSEKPIFSLHTKRFIEQFAKKMGIKKLITHSENESSLNRWHSFLGFTLEKKDDFQYKGIKHNLWSMTWE